MRLPHSFSNEKVHVMTNTSKVILSEQRIGPEADAMSSSLQPGMSS